MLCYNRVLLFFIITGLMDRNSASEFRSTQDREILEPPRNVRVQVTADGYLVTWDPPLAGKDNVKLYIVRWFRGPAEENLHGRAETTDSFYLGKI